MFVTVIMGGFTVFGKIPVIASVDLNPSDVNLSRTSNFRNVFVLPTVSTAISKKVAPVIRDA